MRRLGNEQRQWTLETERQTQRTFALAEEADAAVWSSPASSPTASSVFGGSPSDDRMGELPVRVLKVEVQRRKQRVGAAERAVVALHNAQLACARATEPGSEGGSSSCEAEVV